MASGLDKRSKYALAVDCVIFGYNQQEQKLQVALIKRRNDPFKGYWALPGGFVSGSETVVESALRELKEETGLRDIYLEQLDVFSKPDRDPRGRVISVPFFALISSDALELIADEDAESAQWFSVYDLPSLAFDHMQIYHHALDRLKVAVKTKPIVFELLPERFRLSTLQHIYEQIFDTELDKRNFRKKALSLRYIQETTKVTQGGRHRPARLYRFNRRKYTQENKIF